MTKEEPIRKSHVVRVTEKIFNLVEENREHPDEFFGDILEELMGLNKPTAFVVGNFVFEDETTAQIYAEEEGKPLFKAILI